MLFELDLFLHPISIKNIKATIISLGRTFHP